MLSHVLVYSPAGSLVRALSGELTVGRRAADLIIPGPGIAAAHCRIVRRGADFVLEDRSGGATFLNGARLLAPTALTAGDRIRVADTTLIVDDRFPRAWLTSEDLPERGAPVGPALVVGDPGWETDFPLRKERGHQGRCSLSLRRVDDRWEVGAALDAGVVGGGPLRDGARLRVGTRGVLVFREGPPPEPRRSVFFDSPLARLADLLVSEDEGFREQGRALLEVVRDHARAPEVLDALRLLPPAGPATGHAERPASIGFDEPALLGPRRAAFQYLALHLLDAHRPTTAAFRRSIERLWIGYVPPEPWWERRQLTTRRPALELDLAPLRALPRLRALVVENARRLIGPPVPQVEAVALLGCREVGDYRARFPGVRRWDAHRPIGYP